MLEVIELFDGRPKSVVQIILVEEIDEVAFLLFFLIGIAHPWCLIKQQVFQFLVLGKTAHKAALSDGLFVPFLDSGLDVGREMEQMAGDGVGVERRCLRNGIVGIGNAHRR